MSSTASVTLLNNENATSTAKAWGGGKALFAVKGSAFGSVALQLLLPDNVTWWTPAGASLTADGGIVVELPPGQIRALVTGATNVYATVARIPE